MAQQTPAQMRAAAEADLKAPGGKRLRAKAKLDEIDEELKPFVVRAVAMEVPYRRITDLTGVAPNTARAWAKAAHETDTPEGGST